MERCQVDCTSFFDDLKVRHRTRKRILVGLTEHSYLPDGELLSGWLPKVGTAFAILADSSLNRVKSRHTVCIVGCGPAVDGILSVELLHPQRLILTDIHQDVVITAEENVRRNSLENISTRIEAYVSDLCEVLVRQGIKADLIYENLPNLPALGNLDVAEGALSASFFSMSNDEHGTIPVEYDRHMLGLHYRCLREARLCLRPGGEIVACIGARIPQAIIFQMFLELGYTPSILVADMVEQFEAEKVLAEYAQIEREGGSLQFKFYELDKGRKRLRELIERGLTSETLADEMADQEITMNAQAAFQLHATGQRIGLVGLVLKGTLSR